MYDFPDFMMAATLSDDARAVSTATGPQLDIDLEAARDEGRPAWVAEVELPIDITGERLPMRREVDSRFQRNESREAIRILYELIDNGSGEAQQFAKYYIKEGLIWADEIAFAILAYEHALPDPMSHLQLGMCYLHYRQYEAALTHFRTTIELAPESDTPTEMLRGQIYWSAGQLYGYTGDLTTAACAYRRAEQSYREQSEEPGFPANFKNSVIGHAEKMAEMVEFCRFVGGPGTEGREDEAADTIHDGVYIGSSQGYSGRIDVEVEITRRLMVRVDVTRHKESCPLSAIELIPRRIVEEQTLDVEWVLGAKYTSRAIVAAAFHAVRGSLTVAVDSREE